MKIINFQSVFDTPTVPLSKLNEQGQTPDGRVWEYLKATEAITKHMIVSNPANTTVATVSSSQNAALQNVYISESSASWTAGQFQDHWLLVNAGTGSGQVAKIKDNTYCSTSAGTIELYVDYALATALAVADSGIEIRHEPDAEMCAITVLNTPLKGVAQVTFAASDYGWFLKKGIGGVIVGTAAATINELLTAGGATEGYALNIAANETADDASYVGRVLVANSAASLAALVDVNIA